MKRACRQIIGLLLFIPVGMPLMILFIGLLLLLSVGIPLMTMCALGHVAHDACDERIARMNEWLVKP